MKKELEELLEKLSPEQLNAVIDSIKNPQFKPKSTIVHNLATRHVRIGLCSDLHFGSKYQNIDDIERLWAEFFRQKVTAIYIAGDITEGYGMRRMNLSAHKGGWILDVYAGKRGIEKIVSSLVPFYE